LIVLDASAAIDWILQTVAGQRIQTRIYAAPESLHAPHLLDLEVAQVLRRMAREKSISERRAEEAITDFQDIRIARYPHFLLLPRIWHLRHVLSAYDAAYVALAEHTGATLITRDRRLASASGIQARVETY
jgi:predicted nucleic acid-binding protein